MKDGYNKWFYVAGGPLLLMELALLLRGVGTEVCWITIQKPPGKDEVIYSLEKMMLDRGVQIHLPWCLLQLVVLNAAVVGRWLDVVLNKDVPRVLPKVLWWIHEMQGHYFILDYVMHLPMVAGSMIDSSVTAEYWKNRTQECLKYALVPSFLSLSIP
ncbi:putative Glycosyl-transferase family 4_5 [Helianthus debilis subsp. tardiflorus]